MRTLLAILLCSLTALAQTRSPVGVGATADDDTGDTPRTAMIKVNNNESNVWHQVFTNTSPASRLLFTNTTTAGWVTALGVGGGSGSFVESEWTTNSIPTNAVAAGTTLKYPTNIFYSWVSPYGTIQFAGPGGVIGSQIRAGVNDDGIGWPILVDAAGAVVTNTEPSDSEMLNLATAKQAFVQLTNSYGIVLPRATPPSSDEYTNVAKIYAQTNRSRVSLHGQTTTNTVTGEAFTGELVMAATTNLLSIDDLAVRGYITNYATAGGYLSDADGPALMSGLSVSNKVYDYAKLTFATNRCVNLEVLRQAMGESTANIYKTLTNGIQLAISQSIPLYVPAGTYLLETDVEIFAPENLKIFGDGADVSRFVTTQNRANQHYWWTVYAPRFLTVQGIGFGGAADWEEEDYTLHAYAGFLMVGPFGTTNRVIGVRFNDCAFRGFRFTAVRFSGSATKDYTDHYGNEFWRNDFQLIGRDPTFDSGSVLNPSGQMQIIGNRFEHCGNHATKFYPQLASLYHILYPEFITNSVIAWNTVIARDNPAGTRTLDDSLDFEIDGTHVKVVNNTFISETLQAAVIAIPKANNLYDETDVAGGDILVQGNTFWNGAVIGVQANGFVDVLDNHFASSPRHPATVGLVTMYGSHRVKGNTFRTISPATKPYLVYAYETDGLTRWFTDTSATNYIERAEFTDNMVWGLSGAFIVGHTNFVVKGNQFLTPMDDVADAPGVFTRASSASSALGATWVWDDALWPAASGPIFTHVIGNVSHVTNWTTVVPYKNYDISFTMTDRTAGSVDVTFGGSSLLAQTASKANWLVTAADTAPLVFVPTADFDGKLSVFVVTRDGEWAKGVVEDNVFLGGHAVCESIRGGLAALETVYTRKRNNVILMGREIYVSNGSTNYTGDRDAMERPWSLDAAAQARYVAAQGATRGDTDAAGGTLYLDGGTATGSGSAEVVIRTPTAGAAGVTDRVPTAALTVGANGDVTVDKSAATLRVPNAILSGTLNVTNAAGVAGTTVAVNTNSLVVAGGNVGVGTNAPVAKLEVEGNRTGAALKVNGTQLVVTNGNVGAGTATPAYALDVVGQINSTTAMTAGTYIRAGSSSQIYWNGKSRMSSPTDSYMLLTDNAATDFAGIRFADNTASSPMLRTFTNSTTYTATGTPRISARNAADTDWIPIVAKTIILDHAAATAGNSRGVGAVDLQPVRSAATQVASGISSMIAGGTNNTASGNYSFAAGATNQATGASSVAMGTNNLASGIGAVAVGSANTASGNYSTAFGGQNTASGSYSTAFGGQNTASGSYSTAFGNYSSSPRLGQIAFSSGRFHVTGDAQESIMDLRRSIQTNGVAVGTGVGMTNAWNPLFLDGDSGAQRMVLPYTAATQTNALWTFECKIGGISVTNSTPATDVTFGSYIITGAIKRQINTTTLLAMTVTTIHEDNAAWDVQAVADDTNEALVIEVYPEEDCPKWSASVILNQLTVGP